MMANDPKMSETAKRVQEVAERDLDRAKKRVEQIAGVSWPSDAESIEDPELIEKMREAMKKMVWMPPTQTATIIWPQLAEVCHDGWIVVDEWHRTDCFHESNDSGYRCCRLMCPVWKEWKEWRVK